MNKSEAKYYNTACLMDEALISLLQRKEYAFITVKEICEKAGVNRSTFYLHYESIDDLLSECIDYLNRKLSLMYAEDVIFDKAKIESYSVDELLLITPQHLIPYLEFVRENRATFVAAVSQPTVFKVGEISKSLYQDIFSPIMERYGIKESERAYRTNFYLNGVWAIIQTWIKNGCKENPEELVKIILGCLNIAYR